ncbi:MAG: hypothetical protein ABJP45_10140 [Cyclobacteriaceae bacterium]
MDEVTLAKESFQLILRDFGLEEDSEIEEAKIAFDWLENYLTSKVSYLLDHDFNGLLNALYRIDISESTTKELLQLTSSERIAREIAKAIINREKQKVITRQQFRKQ